MFLGGVDVPGPSTSHFIKFGWDGEKKIFLLFIFSSSLEADFSVLLEKANFKIRKSFKKSFKKEMTFIFGGIGFETFANPFCLKLP